MARGRRNINDRLFTARGRSTAETIAGAEIRRRRRQIRSWVLLVVAVVAVLLGIHFLRRFGKKREIKLTPLDCPASQNVMPFRDGLLYYDGANIHHLASDGSSRWTFPAGTDIEFDAGPDHLAIWSGSQLFLVDGNQYLDEYSLRYPRKNRQVTEETESEFAEMDEAEKERQLAEQRREAYDPFSRERSGAWLAEILRGRGQISAAELPIRTQDDLLMTLSAAAYAQENGLRIQVEDGFTETEEFLLRNFTIRKEGDAGT